MFKMESICKTEGMDGMESKDLISGGGIRMTKLARCAGCGAKVGAGVLASLLGSIPAIPDPDLLVGFDTSDDAAVYRVAPDLAVVQTVDFFPPIADDPYLFGQIAAANALSDVYAMGGEPKFALNLLCFPKSMSSEVVREILRGGYEKAAEAGVTLAGGHSVYDDEPKYGLCVTGFVHPDRILRNAGALPGDRLIATKPFGVGVLSAAAKGDVLSDEAAAQMLRTMATLNRVARDIMVNYRVHACTDVTGFGLLGHTCELAQGSDAAVVLEAGAVEFLPEAVELAKLGVLPEGMYRNRSFAEPFVDPGDTPLYLQDLLYDPQTSGGLLIAVHPDDADAMLSELRGTVPAAQLIGTVCEFSGETRIFLR